MASKRSRGGQRGNKNAVKAGVYTIRNDHGLALPYIPASMKHVRVRVKQYFLDLWQAAEEHHGAPLRVDLASAVHAAAMAHAREIVAWGYLRRCEEELTPDQVASYLSMADRFATAREKAVQRLGLATDDPSDPVAALWRDVTSGRGTGDGSGYCGDDDDDDGDDDGGDHTDQGDDQNGGDDDQIGTEDDADSGSTDDAIIEDIYRRALAVGG